jgi:hypothetical protein
VCSRFLLNSIRQLAARRPARRSSIYHSKDGCSNKRSSFCTAMPISCPETSGSFVNSRVTYCSGISQTRTIYRRTVFLGWIGGFTSIRCLSTYMICFCNTRRKLNSVNAAESGDEAFTSITGNSLDSTLKLALALYQSAGFVPILDRAASLAFFPGPQVYDRHVF